MMKDFLSFAANFVCEEDGATAVEYAILVALIAVAIIAVVVLVGNQVSSAFQSFITCMSAKNC